MLSVKNVHMRHTNASIFKLTIGARMNTKVLLLYSKDLTISLASNIPRPLKGETLASGQGWHAFKGGLPNFQRN